MPPAESTARHRGARPWSSAARAWRPRPELTVGLLLAGLILVFLSPVVTRGGWYLPADLSQLAGVLRTGTGPLHFANASQTDPLVQMDPWLRFGAQQVHAGRIPLWNPDNGLGAPQLANYQSAVLSPFTVPFYVLPYQAALVVAAFLKLWVLGFFTYLFLRRFSLGHVAALTGGVAFSFAGYQVIWLNWPHVGAASVLPMGAWAVTRLLQAPAEDGRERRRSAAWIAVAVATGLLAGHPETFFYSALALTAYTVVALALIGAGVRRRVADVGLMSGGVGLGLAVAAAQLLPFAEYLTRSTAYATRSGVGSAGGTGSISSSLLAFPELIGSPAYPSFDEGRFFGNYAEINSDYVSAIVMCLAVVGLLGLLHRRQRPLALGMGVIATAGFLLFHSQTLSRFAVRAPVLKLVTVNRSHEVWCFGAACLGALGVHELQWLAARVPRRPALASAAALAVVLAGTYAVRDMVDRKDLLVPLLEQLPTPALAAPAARALQHQHVVYILVLWSAAIVVAAVMAASSGLLRRGPGWVLALPGVLLLALVYASTGLLQRGYNPVVSGSDVYPRPPDFAASSAFTGDQLVLRAGGTGLSVDSNLWYGLPDAGSYDAVGVRWSDTLVAALLPADTTGPRFSEGGPTCPGPLRTLGFRFVETELADTPVTGNAGLTAAATFGAIHVWSVNGSTGRYAVVPSVLPTTSEADALARLSSCSFDADATALLLPGTRVPATARPAGSKPAQPESVRVLSESPGRARLLVPGGAGGELVARQTWFPGWHATVDGRSVAIDRVDLALQGIAVGPGRHVVELTYAPSSFTAGAAVSVLGVVGLVAVVSGPEGARRLGRRRLRRSNRRRYGPQAG